MDAVTQSVFDAVKNELSALLDPSSFTTDTAEGCVLILTTLILGHFLWERAVAALHWAAAGTVFYQSMYGLSLTSFNELLPVKQIFNIDIMHRLAETIEGTKSAEVIAWTGSFISAVMIKTWEIAGPYIVSFVNNINEADLLSYLNEGIAQYSQYGI